MENIKTVCDLWVEGRKVLVRGDLEGEPGSPRYIAAVEIIELLLRNRAVKVKIVGHKGDLGTCEKLQNDYRDYLEIVADIRQDSREELDDETFASELAEGWEVYVNEAFATSHRTHTSIVALPQVMKKQGKEVGIGIRFKKELEMLDGIWSKSGKRILIIGGAKAGDKNLLAEELAAKFNAVLPGGLLPGAKLRSDRLDLDKEEIQRFVEVVETGQIIVVAGPMGKFEVPGAEAGTRDVFTAVANSMAYKIAGGGDTEVAISKFGLTNKFDWISVGGGAMLEYLAKGTLVGLEALA